MLFLSWNFPALQIEQEVIPSMYSRPREQNLQVTCSVSVVLSSVIYLPKLQIVQLTLNFKWGIGWMYPAGQMEQFKFWSLMRMRPGGQDSQFILPDPAFDRPVLQVRQEVCPVMLVNVPVTQEMH